jgi:DNA-binding response OmpR family regulator
MNGASPKKEKILIIDADATFSGELEHALKEEGYTVLLATTGADGVRMMVDNLPHLILIDVTLDTMDGYDILAKKQAESLLAKIPVFLLSNQGVPINMRRVPNGSVSEFLMALHVDSVEVIAKVNDLFGYKKPTEEPVLADVTKKKNILWVEDDRLIGNILDKKLLSSGFNLFHAKTGAEALEGLKTFVPDILILDLLLPGMSGFDILQNIRSQETFKHLPVLILSNMNKESDIERATSLGAQKYMVKAAASLDTIVDQIRAMCP